MRRSAPDGATGPEGPRSPQRTPRSRRSALLALLAVALLGAVAGCSGAGALGADAGVQTVTVAIVSNDQMKDAIKLSPQFEAENPGIRMRFVSLSENEARAKITASVATGGGEFDVVMISNYETPQWAQNGWLTDLQPLVDSTPGYDPSRLHPDRPRLALLPGPHVLGAVLRRVVVPHVPQGPVRAGRAHDARAARRGRRSPTWPRSSPTAPEGRAGICLRGKPGWGEMLAPFDTVLNTFGGRWYDPQWHAQLTSPQVEQATQFYVDLVRNYGEPGAAQSGFSECATQFGQGNAAMWYDATSAAGTVENPDESTVVGKVGYAAAPVVATPSSGWLYSWSLAIPKTSPHPDAAWKFMSWMTSKQYMQRVGTQLGWTSLPPGSRLSTYQIPQYQQAAAAFGPTVLDAIQPGETAARRRCSRCPTRACSSCGSRSSRTSARE